MKKILIILLIIVALFLFIFMRPVLLDPHGIFGPLSINAVIESCGPFWGNVLSFYFVSSTLLFWVGIPTGWTFARDCGLGLIGRLILAYICLLLSLPIAIVQLFIPSKQ